MVPFLFERSSNSRNASALCKITFFGALCAVAAVPHALAQSPAKQKPVATSHAAAGQHAVAPAVHIIPIGKPKELRDAQGKLLDWTYQPEEIVKAAADAGDPKAMYFMAQYGKTSEERLAWTLKSAEAGYVPAMLVSAAAYKWGTATAVDPAQAKAWTDRAKAKFDEVWAGNDGGAMFEIAHHFFCGEPPQGPRSETQITIGNEWISWGNEQTSALSFDFQEGMKWLRHASDLGYPGAQMFLATVLQKGAKFQTKNATAQELAKPVADESQYLQLAKKAADSSDPQTILEYAGWYVKPSSEHLELVRKVADMGYPYAMSQLAGLYVSGNDGAKDPAAALTWLRKGVEAGDLNSVVRIANLYCDGTGVPKNGVAAVAYYKEMLKFYDGKPDEQRFAKLGLARLYAVGSCVKQDNTAAIAFYAELAKTPMLWASTEAASFLGLLQGDNSGKNPKLGLTMLQDLAEDKAPFGPGVDKDEIARAQTWLANGYYSGTGVAQDHAKAAELYQKAADLGNDDAMNSLGWLHENGQGVPADQAKAVEWYKKATEKQSWWGTYHLAEHYVSGQGVTQDYSNAAELYRLLATRGEGMPEAMNQLGIRYAQGQGVKNDPAQAADWYRKAAEKGLPRGFAWGAYNLANCYFNGFGVTKDWKEAVNWYQKAADAGLPDAMNLLGIRYENGQGVNKDPAKGAEWYLKAAQKGLAVAAYNLADSYKNGLGVPQDYAKALFWYKFAADRGFLDAELGNLYRDGKGAPQNLLLARTWYEKAAANGNAESAANLGDMYSAGVTVQVDPVKAAAYYKQAADAGNARAQFAYGFLLEHGQGVAHDDAMAARYYDAASKQNNASAMNNLGMMFAQGRGVSRDDERALQLFQAAATLGDASAGQNAQQMAGIVEQERQLRQAQEAAQAASQKAKEDEEERQSRIAELQDKIQELNDEAERWDRTAEETSNNQNSCANTGSYAGLCQSMGSAISTFGSAKARQNAAKARAEAQADLEEIQRLSGMRVQHVQVDTSYAAALQQQTQLHPVQTIQDTLAQQQANIYATAAAAQQQRLAQQQNSFAQRQATANFQQSSRTVASMPAAANPSFNGQPASGGRTGSYASSGTAYGSSGSLGVSSSLGGAASGGSSADLYVPALSANCIRQFWDPQLYNWLAYENNCGRDIHITFIAENTATHISGAFDLRPGQHDNIGRSQSEVRDAGGFSLYVCPLNSIPVDANGNTITVPNASFRCKKW